MKLRIVLYRYKDESTLLSSDENLIQFAECPIAVNPKEDITPFVDSVIDSSRYFVLRYYYYLLILLIIFLFY